MGDFFDDLRTKRFGVVGGGAGEEKIFEIFENGREGVDGDELDDGDLDRLEIDGAGGLDGTDGGIGHVAENFGTEETENAGGGYGDERKNDGEPKVFQG